MLGFDNGASDHITSDLANLAIHEEYKGLDQLIIVGNGQLLKILHTRTT